MHNHTYVQLVQLAAGLIFLQILQPLVHCSVLQADGARTRPSGVLCVFPRFGARGACGDGLQALIWPGHLMFIQVSFVTLHIKTLHSSSWGKETPRQNDGLNKGLNSRSFIFILYYFWVHKQTCVVQQLSVVKIAGFWETVIWKSQHLYLRLCCIFKKKKGITLTGFRTLVQEPVFPL